MPLISTVTPLSGAGIRAAGDCLGAIGAGNLDACDLLIIPVEAGGEVAADQALDAALAVQATDVVAAAQLTGKPGQSAQAVAQGRLSHRQDRLPGHGRQVAARAPAGRR